MKNVVPGAVQFDASAKPVLTVKPGEVVTIDTICGVPEMLERLGAATDEPIREMKQMYAEIKDRGRGRTSSRAGPGIQILIHPFFGVLGVAPPEGRLSSGPPSYNAGNLVVSEMCVDEDRLKTTPPSAPKGICRLPEGIRPSVKASPSWPRFPKVSA